MRVTFFFPYKVISGVPILFANMANELSKLKYDVSVVDYYEGILWKHSNNSVKKIRFEDGKKIETTIEKRGSSSSKKVEVTVLKTGEKQITIEEY